jgi:hypothetical protein
VAESTLPIADRFGINLSLLVLRVVLLIAGIWMISHPLFENAAR